MIKIISIVIIQIASYASILGLYYSVASQEAERLYWHKILLIIIFIFTVITIFHDVKSFLRARPRRYKDDRKIVQFMETWVKNAGRVVIFSRDMTWASEKNVKAILEEKSKRGELTICLEKSTEITDYLEPFGANIITYKELGHVPKSRFTIVDFDRHGSRVAIGAKINGTHVIQEFENGPDILFAITEDLVKLLIGFQEYKNNASRC